MNSTVTFWVGGVPFMTTRDTVMRGEHFFSGLLRAADDSQSEFFVDRDPTVFRFVLNHLRGANVLPNDELSLRELDVEADFYSMPDLQRSVRMQLRETSTHERLMQRLVVAVNSLRV